MNVGAMVVAVVISLIAGAIGSFIVRKAVPRHASTGIEIAIVAVSIAIGLLIGRMWSASEAHLPKVTPSASVSIPKITPSSLFGKKSETAEDLEAQLTSNALFSLIKTEYPEEFAGFLTQLSAVTRPEDGGTLGHAFTETLRMTHADDMKRAPGPDARRVVLGSYDLIRNVETRFGREACVTIALDGVSGLPASQRPDDALIDAQAMNMFRALSAGRHAHTPSADTPTAQDYAAFLTHWRNQGASQQDIDAVANGARAAENYCSAILSFGDAIRTFDGPVADRVVTEFAYQLAATR